MKCLPLLLALAVLSGCSPAMTEKASVEAIRARRPGTSASALANAIDRIDALRGQLEFDAAGNLVAVDLASDRVSVADTDLVVLAGLPHLERLKLSGGEITDRGVEQLARLTGLTELALERSQIDDAGLGRLAVAGAAQVAQPAGLGQPYRRRDGTTPPASPLDRALAVGRQGDQRRRHRPAHALAGLRALDLRGCVRVSDKGLSHLRAFPELRDLRLGGELVTDATMAAVADLHSLQSLTIVSSPVTNAGLARIRDLPIAELTLYSCLRINDDGLEVLSSLPLVQLSLRDMPIKGPGLVHLRGKRELKFLKLNQCYVNDEGLAHLRDLTALAHLELPQTQITDAGLADGRRPAEPGVSGPRRRRPVGRGRGLAGEGSRSSAV